MSATDVADEIRAAVAQAHPHDHDEEFRAIRAELMHVLIKAHSVLGDGVWNPTDDRIGDINRGWLEQLRQRGRK